MGQSTDPWNNTKDSDRLVMTVDEARKCLGLSRGLIYDAIRRGEIPSVRIGRRILIPRAGLQRLLEEAQPLTH